MELCGGAAWELKAIGKQTEQNAGKAHSMKMGIQSKPRDSVY